MLAASLFDGLSRRPDGRRWNQQSNCGFNAQARGAHGYAKSPAVTGKKPA
jgi:hypothetical protein